MSLKPILFGFFLGVVLTSGYFLQKHARESHLNANNGSDESSKLEANGWTVLHRAAYNGDEATFSSMNLMSQSQQIDSLDKFGLTPLMYAAERGHSSIVQLLLQLGADPNIQTPTGMTPLLFVTATSIEQVKTAQQLIEAGANVNLADHEGFTPLMAAAVRNHTNLVALLTAKGANKRLRNIQNLTASDLAMSKGNQSIAKLLESQ